MLQRQAGCVQNGMHGIDLVFHPDIEAMILIDII
jgi:hypothetical protein